VPFSEQPFQIPRYILARLAAEIYVRSFWWFIIIPPVFGVICLFSGSQLLYGVGMLGVLWPITIPARAAFISAAAGKFFSKPVRVVLSANTLYFYGSESRGMKLSLANVRKIEERHGYILLIYGIGQFAAIPTEISIPLDELVSLAEAAREPATESETIADQKS
jgi:hypothetical protein